MIDERVEQEILEHLSQLPAEAQREVAKFARGLAARHSAGQVAKTLLRFAGTIDRSDLKAMEEAIQEACEKVDHEQW